MKRLTHHPKQTKSPLERLKRYIELRAINRKREERELRRITLERRLFLLELSKGMREVDKQIESYYKTASKYNTI